MTPLLKNIVFENKLYHILINEPSQEKPQKESPL